MVAAGTEGVIVNVELGQVTRPALNLAPYGAAKAAINHLTSTLAVEARAEGDPGGRPCARHDPHTGGEGRPRGRRGPSTGSWLRTPWVASPSPTTSAASWWHWASDLGRRPSRASSSSATTARTSPSTARTRSHHPIEPASKTSDSERIDAGCVVHD